MSDTTYSYGADFDTHSKPTRFYGTVTRWDGADDDCQPREVWRGEAIHATEEAAKLEARSVAIARTRMLADPYRDGPMPEDEAAWRDDNERHHYGRS